MQPPQHSRGIKLNQGLPGPQDQLEVATGCHPNVTRAPVESNQDVPGPDFPVQIGTRTIFSVLLFVYMSPYLL